MFPSSLSCHSGSESVLHTMRKKAQQRWTEVNKEYEKLGNLRNGLKQKNTAQCERSTICKVGKMTAVRKNIFPSHLIWSVHIHEYMLLPFITQSQHAVKIRIQGDAFFHHRFVNEWFLWEAGGTAEKKGSRSKEIEGKCGFDLGFRLKIHQDLFNRCICQAGGNTQSGLHNHILFGCSRAEVCVCVFVCMCRANLRRRQTRNLYSLPKPLWYLDTAR